MKPGNRIWRGVLRLMRRQKAAERLVAIKGLQRAHEALHGPPATPEQLREAEADIARQNARDFGAGQLF